MDYSSFWWDSVTGPHRMIQDITKALIHGKNILLQVPVDLAWRWKMRNKVEEACHTESERSVYFYPIDVSDEISSILQEGILSVADAGMFLLKYFASGKPEITEGYRPNSRTSIYEYVRNSNVLNRRIVWLKGVPKKSQPIIASFIDHYNTAGIDNGGVLVMEYNKLGEEAGNAVTIRYSQYVSIYDVQILNLMILNQNDSKFSALWKQYLATLGANLCQSDAEVSTALLEDVDLLRTDTQKALKQVSEMSEFQQRGIDERHVLFRVRQNRSTDNQWINHQIWKTQIQICMPIIEIRRMTLIQKWYSILKQLLDTEPEEQLGEFVKDPEELELGTLYHMVMNRFRSNDVTWEDKYEIKSLRESRNHLAHGKICGLGEMAYLLSRDTQ